MVKPSAKAEKHKFHFYFSKMLEGDLKKFFAKLLNIFLITLLPYLEAKSQERKILTINDKPEIEPIPRVVTEESIKIRGRTCPFCTVVVDLEGKKFQGVADRYGRFSVEVFLNLDAENELTIFAIEAGKQSPEVKVKVIQSTKPVVSIDQPPIIYYDKIPKYTREPSVEIEGKGPPKTLIVARGGTVESTAYTDIHGNFKITVFLHFDRLNEIKITAEDERGFVSPPAIVRIYQITKAPPAPKLINYPEYTNLDVVRIEGKSVPGVDVIARLPGKIATTKTDEEGEFVLEVPIPLKNTLNEIEIYVRDPAGNISPSVVAKIWHDNIPPPPPQISEFPAQTIREKVTITGRTEANAIILQKTYDKEVSVAVADEFGNFAVEVEVKDFLRQVRVNTFEFIAVDRAGNRSAPTIVSIARLPDIKKGGLQLYVGAHTYSNIFGNPYFEDNEKRGYISSIYSFASPTVELKADWLFSRGSGPIAGISIGFKRSFNIEFTPPYLRVERPELLPELGYIYIYQLNLFPRFGWAFMIENIDFIGTVGPAISRVWRNVPTPQLQRQTQVFTGFGVRAEAQTRYFLSKTFSIGAVVSFAFVRVSNFGQEGQWADVGGIFVLAGAGWHF